MSAERPTRAELLRRWRRTLEVERAFGYEPPVAWPRSAFPEVQAPRAPTPGPPAARRSPGPPPGRSPGPPAGGAPSAGSRPPAPPPAAVPADSWLGSSPSSPSLEQVRAARGELGEEALRAERARREALLAPLRESLETCTRCRLAAGRQRLVFGVGDPCARLLWVGEGPGADEDRQGEPFVGKAGQLLDDIIRAMGLERSELYIANIVKCRPPNNRNPAQDEIATCRPFLLEQIAMIRPEVICCLGATAARSLLGVRQGVGALRGRFHDFDGIAVRVTYHPAYLLREPGEKRKTWVDVQAVMARLAGS